MSRHLKPAALIALSLMAASPTAAATYTFSMGAALGTFDAPLGGGLISSFGVTLGNTDFDTLDVGAAAPVYNPILNTLNGLMDVEFRGAGLPTAQVFNSIASAACPLGQCVLSLFDTVGGTALPEYLALNTVTLQNVAFGYYSIDPEIGHGPGPVAGHGLASRLRARRAWPCGAAEGGLTTLATAFHRPGPGAVADPYLLKMQASELKQVKFAF